MNNKGYIYVIINPWMPDLIKIGYSSDVDNRIKQFDSETSSPRGWIKYATLQTSIYAADKKIHNIITSLKPESRVDEKREFFKIDPEIVCEILSDIAELTGEEFKQYEINAKDESIIKKSLNGQRSIREIELEFLQNFKAYFFSDQSMKTIFAERNPNNHANYCDFIIKNQSTVAHPILRARSNEISIEWYMTDKTKDLFTKLLSNKNLIENEFNGYTVQWDRGTNQLKSKISIDIDWDYSNSNYSTIKDLLIKMNNVCTKYSL